jgi:hypothetical protein
MSGDHPDCRPNAQCIVCRQPIRCGDAIVTPWRRRPGSGDRHRDCPGKTGWFRIYHCSTACYWRQLRAQRRQERMRTVVCQSCGGEFQALRREARTCSPACRQETYRQREGAR